MSTDVPDGLFNAAFRAWRRSGELDTKGRLEDALAAVLPEHEKQLRAERDALKAAIAIGKLPGFAADVLALVDDYSDKEQSLIARLPFLATFDQLCFEKYGFSTDPPTALAVPESTDDHAPDCDAGSKFLGDDPACHCW